MTEPRPTLNLDRKMDLFVNRLLAGNESFIERTNRDDPEFFARQAIKQTPQALWIGCSDSRVAAEVITETEPGNMFVHRNIANMVVHTDMNLLCAMDYAINHLQVKHVIVCGHYECGGVAAAMGDHQFGLIDNWLRNLKDVYRIHRQELDAIEDRAARTRRFVECNVLEQVYNVCKTSIVQRAWKERGTPYIHGWVYDLATGRLVDLGVNVSGRKDLEAIYRLDVDQALGGS